MSRNDDSLSDEERALLAKAKSRLADWLRALRPRQRERVASAMGLASPDLLRQMASQKRYSRPITAKQAVRLEAAAVQAREQDRAIPLISRAQICPTCIECPFAQTAAGDTGEASS